MDNVLSVQAMVRSYHYYKAIWEAAIDGQVFSCKREVGNVHDTFAIPEFAIVRNHDKLCLAICPQSRKMESSD